MSLAVTFLTVVSSLTVLIVSTDSNKVSASISNCTITPFLDQFTSGLNGDYYYYIGSDEMISFENGELNMNRYDFMTYFGAYSEDYDLNDSENAIFTIDITGLSTPSSNYERVFGGISLIDPLLYGFNISYSLNSTGEYTIDTYTAVIGEDPNYKTVSVGTTFQETKLVIIKEGNNYTSFYKLGNGSYQKMTEHSHSAYGLYPMILGSISVDTDPEEVPTEDFTVTADNYSIGCNLPSGLTLESEVKQIDVFRFFNTSSGTHFYTGSTKEKNKVISKLPDYAYEDVVYKAYNGQKSGTKPVYRFYNTSNGTHFYTAGESEKNKVMNMSQYNYEGIVYYIFGSQRSGTTPVYRFFNTSNGTHFYTGSNKEKNKVINNNPEMNFEGVVYYAMK